MSKRVFIFFGWALSSIFKTPADLEGSIDFRFLSLLKPTLTTRLPVSDSSELVCHSMDLPWVFGDLFPAERPRLVSKSSDLFLKTFEGDCLVGPQDKYCIGGNLTAFVGGKTVFAPEDARAKAPLVPEVVHQSPIGWIWSSFVFFKANRTLTAGTFYILKGKNHKMTVSILQVLSPRVYLFDSYQPYASLEILSIEDIESQLHRIEFEAHQPYYSLLVSPHPQLIVEETEPYVLGVTNKEDPILRFVRRPLAEFGGTHFVDTNDEGLETDLKKELVFLPKGFEYIISPCDFELRDFRLVPLNCSKHLIDPEDKPTVFIFLNNTLFEVEKLGFRSLLPSFDFYRWLPHSNFVLGYPVPRKPAQKKFLKPKENSLISKNVAQVPIVISKIRKQNFLALLELKVLTKESYGHFTFSDPKGMALVHLVFFSSYRCLIVSKSNVFFHKAKPSERLLFHKQGTKFVVFKQSGPITRVLAFFDDPKVGGISSLEVHPSHTDQILFEGFSVLKNARFPAYFSNLIRGNRLRYKPFTKMSRMKNEGCRDGYALMLKDFQCGPGINRLSETRSSSDGCEKHVEVFSFVFCSDRQRQNLMLELLKDFHKEMCVREPRGKTPEFTSKEM